MVFGNKVYIFFTEVPILIHVYMGISGDGFVFSFGPDRDTLLKNKGYT